MEQTPGFAVTNLTRDEIEAILEFMDRNYEFYEPTEEDIPVTRKNILGEELAPTLSLSLDVALTVVSVELRRLRQQYGRRMNMTITGNDNTILFETHPFSRVGKTKGRIVGDEFDSVHAAYDNVINKLRVAYEE